MTSGPLNNSSEVTCDLERFKPRQIEQVQAILQAAHSQFATLDEDDCQALRTIWSLLARATAPVALSANSRQSDAEIRRTLEVLSASGLIWYDADLRCVLECPPFSALTTNHRVKAFGWNTTHVCSLIDAPLALLLYGPNTWLTIQSTCQHSGEMLEFQLLVNDEQRLRTHTPLEAADWRVWIPAPSESSPVSARYQHGAFSFYSLADFETYYGYHKDEAGVLYSFFDAIALSECLIKIYHSALRL